MNPPPGKITAVVKLSDWREFRIGIGWEVLNVVSALTFEAAKAAVLSLKSADESVSIEWRDKEQYVVMPWDAWDLFRWELLLNVFGYIWSQNKEAGDRAKQVFTDAEKLVVAEWRAPEIPS